MDNRLNDALAFANYRLTLQIQRQNIEARVSAALLISYQNAIFKTSTDLVAFVDAKIKAGGELRVEDQSGNVITIANPQEFLTQLISSFDNAMKLKQEEQQRLKSARSTAKIVGL
jgi:ABC-type transport system involved in Fe-S cluster assembly fused permease/ATPase subunit